MLQVIKLGGATLATPQKVGKMAQAILGLKSKRNKIVAVVSAMGNTTNKLYDDFVSATQNRGKPRDLESYLGLGEFASANLLAGALKALGAKAEVLSPYQARWPLKIKVKSNNVPLRQKQNEQKDFSLLARSASRLKKTLNTLLKQDITPVVTGFIAADEKNQVVTLGRGGSDISAFLIGKIIGADEVILVKDVKGVLAWDPRLLKSKKAPHVSFLESNDLFVLSNAGARVVHPGALKYLTPGTKARVVGESAVNWQDSGTHIHAAGDNELVLSSKTLAAITFIGNQLESTPGLLHALTKNLRKHHISIYGLTVSDRCVAFYVNQEKAQKAYELLVKASQKFSQFKSSTLKEGLVKVTIRSHEFIDSPGIIAKLVKPVAKAKINIWELETVHADISFIVEEKNARRVSELLSRSFFGKKGRAPKPVMSQPA